MRPRKRSPEAAKFSVPKSGTTFSGQTFIGVTRVPTLGTGPPNASFTHQALGTTGEETMRPKRTSIGVSRMSRFRNKQKKRQAKHYRGQGRPS
jgi:hypothetical protein